MLADRRAAGGRWYGPPSSRVVCRPNAPSGSCGSSQSCDRNRISGCPHVLRRSARMTTSRPSAIAAVPAARKRVPWPRLSTAALLCCLVCESEELCGSGLCPRCCDASCHSETHSAGLKEEVLERDRCRCRVCGAATDIVHHRKPGRNDLAWLTTLRAACHATMHRLQALDRCLPALLRELWREQHPEAPALQLPFNWEAPA